jgi:hypothetical protein
VFSLIALGGTAFLGFDRWQDDDGAAQPQATATGWSAAECADARRALDAMRFDSGECYPRSVDACAQLEVTINDNCP